jgi:hypothetical protein
MTQLKALMEDATYTETGYIVFVIHCELLGSGLYNIAPSHLLCNCTGMVKIKYKVKVTRDRPRWPKGFLVG